MCSPSSLWLVLALVLVGACSSSSMPPALGDCTGDGGCARSGSGGGAGSSSGGGDDGGDDATGGACSVSASLSQCDQCVGTNCCADLETCGGSTTCENLLACVDACTSQACQTTCLQKYNGAASMTYQALLLCMSQKCPVCGELGAGDPCGASSVACNAGLTCSGLWCTRSCTKAADCTGLGANGGNFTGNPGACRHLSNGDFCFPGCSGDADCTDFPGTYCLQTTDLDGSAVSVCAAGPDAGLE
jgi:hypothetical protein